MLFIKKNKKQPESNKEMTDTLNDISCIYLNRWLQKPYNCIRKKLMIIN